MKLSEFSEILGKIIEKCNQTGEDPSVTLVLAHKTVGPTATTDIVSATLGFDWNKGRLLIRTKDPVEALKDHTSTPTGRPFTPYFLDKYNEALEALKENTSGKSMGANQVIYYAQQKVGKNKVNQIALIEKAIEIGIQIY